MPQEADGFLKDYLDRAQDWNHGSPDLPKCNGTDGLFSQYKCDMQVAADEDVTINVLQEFAKEMGVGQTCTDGRLPSYQETFSTLTHSNLDRLNKDIYNLIPETWMCTISQGTGAHSNIYSLHWQRM